MSVFFDLMMFVRIIVSNVLCICIAKVLISDSFMVYRTYLDILRLLDCKTIDFGVFKVHMLAIKATINV